MGSEHIIENGEYRYRKIDAFRKKEKEITQQIDLKNKRILGSEGNMLRFDFEK